MKGYMGKLLRVNLSTGKISTEPLDPKMAQDYIGGAGLGVRLAYQEIPPETDPLSPKAKLFLLTGPVTGTALGTTGRYEVVFKAPLTGILCDSSSSGHWGAEFKWTGYDALIVEGAASKPVYLFIHDGEVEIKDATHLWGMDTYQVQEALRNEVGEPKAKIVAIGPAGERGVLYSCMINDAGRAPGRGGNGAVMGSKKLKAIVVRGTQEVELADPEGYKRAALDINRLNATSPKIANLREYGTAEVMDNSWQVGDIPVKNWALGSYEQLCVSLGGKKMKETILVPHVACHRCTIGCSRWVRIKEGPFQMDAAGPEYETLGALGSMCLVDDLEAVSYAAHLCNLYGMDTISCGSSIAFAMECYEKGLLTKKDTGGLELTWGNKEALVEAVRQIAFGEGIGKLLGQGTRRMAEQIGRGSMDFAVQVKGLEVPMHDPRAFFSWAVNYATSPRGACHLHGMSGIYEHTNDPLASLAEWGLTDFYPRHSNEHKAKIAALAQDWAHLVDSMVICYFCSFTLQPSDLANLLNLATGSQYTVEDLRIIGERINALYRAYNYRCGIRRADDTLPVRSLTPVAEGGAAGKVPDLEYQLKEYYELRGWEPDGKPSKARLLELGLEEAARDLYG
jgi:aldehyde:ferredoxin oxidoreductase